MCNDFGNHIPYDDYLRAFSQIRIPVRLPKAAPNLEPRDDIWPTDTAPIIRQTEDGHEFTQLRWGFPPAKPKGAPIINFRSEGRKFLKGRCLVPASHFYEFTGTKSPKTKWRFTKTGEEWFCFAGLWRPLPDGSGLASGVIGGPQDTTAWSFASNYQHTFSSNLLNEVRVGDTRRTVSRSAAQLSSSAGAALSIPGIPSNAQFPNTLPTFLIAGYQQLGSPVNTASDFNTSVTEVADSLTWLTGRHTIKMGLDWRWERLNVIQPPSPTGFSTKLVILEFFRFTAPNRPGGCTVVTVASVFWVR